MTGSFPEQGRDSLRWDQSKSEVASEELQFVHVVRNLQAGAKLPSSQGLLETRQGAEDTAAPQVSGWALKCLGMPAQASESL